MVQPLPPYPEREGVVKHHLRERINDLIARIVVTFYTRSKNRILGETETSGLYLYFINFVMIAHYTNTCVVQVPVI